jgi:hypothetical protein
MRVAIADLRGLVWLLWPMAGLVSPARAQPAEPAGELAAPAADTEIALHVTADDPTFALAVETGTSYRSNGLGDAVVRLYDVLCRAPCETTITPGRYQLAVEHRGSYYPLAARSELSSEADLHLSIRRPRLQRGLATVFLLAGLAVAGAFVGLLITHSDDPDNPTLARDVGLAAAGGAVALIAGITLAFATTETRIAIQPVR